MQSKIIPVVLSGGSGTRLWPLSRASYPKQFLALAGEQSLIQQTVTRARQASAAPPARSFAIGEVASRGPLIAPRDLRFSTISGSP